MEIKVTPNQTIKDFSYGRKFVRGLSSRSIMPVMLLEASVELGRTYQAYQRGGYTEARERLTEELIGGIFWFSGVPLFSKLIDKYVGKKVFKLPDTDFETGKDSLRNPVKNYLNKFKANFKNPEQAEKMIAKYKFGKVLASIILANCLVGLALPKINQGITKHILKKKAKEKADNNSNNTLDTGIKNKSMDDFIKKSSKDVGFGAISPQTLMSLAYSFENNPKYGLICTDLGVWAGRGLCARNEYERTEVLFRDISSSYFYMFNMPVIAALLNKMQDGKSSRLDTIGAKQVSDHLNEILKANGGAMKADAFRQLVLGCEDNKAYIVPSVAKAIRENKGVIETDKFIDMLKEVKLRYPEADIEKFIKNAKGMSELQPKLGGKRVISEKQIIDVFTDGAINMPEFLKNVYKCMTSDQNLFTGKVGEAGYDKDFVFISKETFLKKQKEIADFVESIIKKAKNGEITKDLINKACKKNYIKNSINWVSGFLISAAFLSTFIPKIQYWITKKATGSNEFPGTADYSKK